MVPVHVELDAVRLGLAYEQINLASSAVAEQIVRPLVHHEVAMEQDAKHSNYGGLGNLGARTGCSEDRGRAALPNFQQADPQVQRGRAQVLKQARLLREGEAAEAKRRKARAREKKGSRAPTAPLPSRISGSG